MQEQIDRLNADISAKLQMIKSYESYVDRLYDEIEMRKKERQELQELQDKLLTKEKTTINVPDDVLELILEAMREHLLRYGFAPFSTEFSMAGGSALGTNFYMHVKNNLAQEPIKYDVTDYQNW